LQKKKIKVLDQLEVKLKKFTVNDLFRKDTKVQRLNSIEDRGEIEKIKCLMVNLHKSKTMHHNEKGSEIQG
jgi:hypothetical protein